MATTNDRVYPLVQELIATITKQQATCERLLALCKEERRAIVTNHLDELASAVEEKELLINRLGHLEQRKQKTRNTLAQALTCDSQYDPLGAHYEQLLPLLPTEHQEELMRAEKQRTATIIQLAKSNSANATLINDLMDISQEFLHSLTKLINRGCSYSALGQLQQTSPSALTSFNRQV